MKYLCVNQFTFAENNYEITEKKVKTFKIPFIFNEL
jgi:hypothetical protein